MLSVAIDVNVRKWADLKQRVFFFKFITSLMNEFSSILLSRLNLYPYYTQKIGDKCLVI